MREYNIGLDTVVEFLQAKGQGVSRSPGTVLTPEQYSLLQKEFSSSAALKKEAQGRTVGRQSADNIIINADGTHREARRPADAEPIAPSAVRNAAFGQTEAKRDAPKPAQQQPQAEKVERPQPAGLNVLGKIDLNAKPKPVAHAPKPVDETPKPAEAPKPAAPVAAAAEPKVEVPVAAVAPAPAVVETSPAPKAEPAPEVKAEAKPEPKPVQAAPEVVKEPVAAQPEAAKPAAAPDAAPAQPAPKAEQPAKPVQAAPKAEHQPQSKPAQPKSDAANASKPASDKPAAPTQPVAEAAAQPTAESPANDDNTPVEVIKAEAEQLKGLTVLGKIQLPVDKGRNQGGKPGQGGGQGKPGEKRQRKRMKTTPGSGPTNQGVKIDDNANQRGGRPGGGPGGHGGHGGPGNRNNNRPGQGGPNRGGNAHGGGGKAPEPTEKEIQDQIKATLARLSGGKGNPQAGNRAKYRRDRRQEFSNNRDQAALNEQKEAQILKVTEFISVADIASLMDVSVNEVIKACLSAGYFVSINQRLDANTIELIGVEFGFDVQFVTAEEEENIEEIVDAEEDMKPRAPIVTIMGHVDHGKTSLLDFIRNTKVVAGEAGGITQHIGAYDVTTNSGKKITFLDTPGHEAFTAMRARGAKVTDVAIIVVAADDSVMPQTKEAINHAQVAGVPMVIAINKIDKPGANPEKIKEELAQMNILVEDWGGKFQCQEISAKKGIGIDELLEKVLLEAELLELKANPDRLAVGTVIEASLDRGRGYVTTVLVQAGTLNVGDVILVGPYFGKVKAMTDHIGAKIKAAGPSVPVQVLGLDGAPQAGDKFVVMELEREAREIATKRGQILREQSIRTKKHITLDEIARRKAIGNFKQLNLIIKGDFDGSVEALSDSLQKLSTPELEVNILHKAVGQISESDVLLASASDAIIIGFQVRPSTGARKLIEQEQVELKLYSIIYAAIDDVKDAIEGMHAPTFETVMVGSAEIRQVFKISKIGTVGGCMVTEGTITRKNKIKIFRDGIEVYNGDIDALKRFKDDVSEVRQGYECGMSFKGFNDLQEGDIIDAFETREIKRGA